MKVLEVYDDNTIEVEMTEEERDFLVEYAFNDLLRKGIESFNYENDICPSISNSE